MNNFLKINYNLNNLEDILKQSVNNNRYAYVYFRNSDKDKLIKLKKPKKKDILKLKNKLENIENIFSLNFIDFCVYKELFCSFQDLKYVFLGFINCSLEEGTEQEIKKLLNNCRHIKISTKMKKRLSFSVKQYLLKVQKNLYLDSLDYKSIKCFLFGLKLRILTLNNIKANKRDMRKLMKSLHRTVSLISFKYAERKAYGLIHELKNDLKNNSVDLSFENKKSKVKGIFLNTISTWIKEVQIKSSYENKDFKYLLTKFYKGGKFSKIKEDIKIFGILTKQNEINLLEFVNKLK